jgi:WD40 repeat protein
VAVKELFVSLVAAMSTAWSLQASDRDAQNASTTIIVNCVGISPDGAFLAAGGNKGEVLLWRLDKEDSPKRLNVKASVNSLSFGPSNQLAVACSDGRIAILDPAKGTVTFSIALDVKALNSCQFANKNNNLFVAGDTGKVFVVNLGTQRIAKTWQLPRRVVRLSLVDAESSLVASLWEESNGQNDGNQRGEIVLLKLNGEGQQRVIASQEGKISCLTLLPNGQLLAGGFDGMIRVYDIQAARVLREWKNGAMVTCCDLAAASGKLISGDVDGAVKVWDLRSGKVEEEYHRKNFLVIETAISSDGQLIAFCNCDLELTSSIVRTIRKHSLK